MYYAYLGLIMLFSFASSVAWANYWYNEGWNKGVAHVYNRYEQSDADLDAVNKQLDQWHDELLARKAIKQSKAKKNN